MHEVIGDELVLIDGDALLSIVFATKGLAIGGDDGFQLLHAVSILECILRSLRLLNYNIVFFGNHASIATKSRNDLDLARECIIRHLDEETNVIVCTFPAFSSVEFEAYLDINRPLFIFCTDGGQNTRDEKPVESKNSTHWRFLILQALRRGMDVALLDAMQFRDGKILAYSILRASEDEKSSLMDDSFDQQLHEMQTSLAAVKLQEDTTPTSVVTAEPGKENIVVNALASLVDVVEHGFILAIATTFIIAQRLDLLDRFSNSDTLVLKDTKVQSALDEFYKASARVIRSLPSTKNCDLADYFDARLLSTILQNQGSLTVRSWRALADLP